MVDEYLEAIGRLDEISVLVVDSEDADNVLAVERVVPSGVVPVEVPVIPKTELCTQVLDEADDDSSVLCKACEVVLV